MATEPDDDEREGPGADEWSIVFVSESSLEADIVADALEEAEMPVSIESVGRNSNEVLVPDEQAAKARELLRALREGSGEASERYRNRVKAATLVDEGRALFELGQVDAAMERYRTATELDPRCAAAHMGVAFVLRKQNRPEEAHAALLKAVEIDPENRNAWMNLAQHRLETHHPEEARAAYAKVIELYPDDIRAHRGIGNAHLSEWNLAEALKAFEQALELDPDDTLSLMNAGICLSRLGRQEEALALGERALQADPDHLGAMMFCGRMEWRLKRYAESEDTLTDALEQHKDHPEVQSYLAATWIDAGGRMERAKKLLDRALGKHPSHPLVKLTLARLHAAEKDNPYRDPAASERLAREVAAASPKNPDFQCELAEILLGVGKTDEARQAAEEAVRIAGQVRRFQDVLARTK